MRGRLRTAVALGAALLVGVVAGPATAAVEEEAEAAPGPVTAVYIYQKVNPEARPSWGNSGVQRLVEVRDGHGWLRDLDPALLPEDVCGPGWGVQIDWVVGLEADQVPPVVDRATGTGLMGWGRAVLQARHHSLEYVTDVAPCETTTPGPVTAVYVYPKVDPDAPAAWVNSGPQRLVEIRDGHQVVRDLDPALLPEDVCGPGWGAQVDWFVGLERDEVPVFVDRATGTGMVGWGVHVIEAHHHSLEYVTDVPPCADEGALAP